MMFKENVIKGLIILFSKHMLLKMIFTNFFPEIIHSMVWAGLEMEPNGVLQAEKSGKKLIFELGNYNSK